MISPHDSKTLYFGGNRVFRSTDRGDTWTAGPDLTRARGSQRRSRSWAMKPTAEVLATQRRRGRVGHDHALAESRVQAGLLWAGTDDGLVQVSRDSGKTWRNVTDRIPGAGAQGPRQPRRAVAARCGHRHVSFDRHQDDDFAPVSVRVARLRRDVEGGVGRICRRPGGSTSSRSTRRTRACCLPAPKRACSCRSNGGADWTRFTHGFPTVPVDDLVIHPRDNDLIVGTHGRIHLRAGRHLAAQRLTSADRGCRAASVPSAAATPSSALEARELQRAARVRRTQPAGGRDAHVSREGGQQRSRAASASADAAGRSCAN